MAESITWLRPELVRSHNAASTRKTS
jgi:hypothetical protein